MQVAILGDTHISDREATLPSSFRDRIRGADHVIHAGDFTSTETLAEIRDAASELTAVKGNKDDYLIDLPSRTTVELGGVNFGVTHGHLKNGDLVRVEDDWLDAVADAARDAGGDPCVGVGAHSHHVIDRVHDGVRVLNPGSATGADPSASATMLTAEVADGELDVTVHQAD